MTTKGSWYFTLTADGIHFGNKIDINMFEISATPCSHIKIARFFQIHMGAEMLVDILKAFVAIAVQEPPL